MTKDQASSSELEASLGKDQVGLRAKGEFAERLGNSLADLLSPFTNAAGALGDMVRTFRQENAIRALSRARELATDLAIDVKPVPPKFLLQWVEAASLEEPGPHDLSELWANLLLSASQGTHPTHLLFKRILSELNARHVDLLKWLCDYDDTKQVFNFQNIAKYAQAWNKRVNKDQVEQLNDTTLEAVHELVSGINSSGLGIYRIKFGKAGAPPWYNKDTIFDVVHNQATSFSEDYSFEYLKLSGIISVAQGSIRCELNSERYIIELEAWYITPLGIEFLKACNIKGGTGS